MSTALQLFVSFPEMFELDAVKRITYQRLAPLEPQG
jgi:hypothetical protein